MRDHLSIFGSRLTRLVKASGALCAYSLAELQEPSKEFKGPPCKTHKWREGKWFFHCRRCGAVMELPPTPALKCSEATAKFLASLN